MTFTEIGLFIVSLALGLPTGILLGSWLWDKYQAWVLKNFVISQVKCPRCGEKEMFMYNSNYCYDCYYQMIAERKEKKNG